MTNSTARPHVSKPRPDFPLFPHNGTGRWAKKVRGKRHYFGPIAGDENGQAALKRWREQEVDLRAGRTPRPKTDELTVKDLLNRFLAAKEQQRDAGEIAPRTWDGYKRVCDRIAGAFGLDQPLADLRPEDFEALKASIAKSYGLLATGNEITKIRVVFRYGYLAGLLEREMRYGPLFTRPSKSVLRRERARRGPRLISAADIRRLIDHASKQLSAMILLSANTGLGNSDLARMELRHVDLDAGTLDYPRLKTGCERRAVLWAETVAALKGVLAKRATPQNKAHANLVFLTQTGRQWVANIDNISRMFNNLAAKLEIKAAFYDLRRTFRTKADGCLDQPAVDLVMGHDNGSMANTYRQRIDDERLARVAQHVHDWLFAARGGRAEQPAERLRIVG